MIAVLFLIKCPDISDVACLWAKLEILLCDEIDHFVSGEKEGRVEVMTALAIPDDDLPDRKPANDVLSILQQSRLYAPFVVIEDGTGRGNKAHHLSETIALPCHIFIMGHVI